jgi:DNA segregation ATPase FtsK/SpoIIIE-like protein
MKKTLSEYNDAHHIQVSAKLIEASLRSFGIFAKVVEICIEEKFYKYCLELGMGTDLKKLEKHGKDLAMVLASPTGRVYWQIPVPGKSYVGLKVPKPPKEYFEKLKQEEESWKKHNNLRHKIAFFLFLIANKILGEDYPNK